MEQGFKFLKVSVITFKVLAWISLVFFLVISVIVLLGIGGTELPRLMSLVFLFGGGFYFLILFSIAEVFRILLFISAKVNHLLNLPDRQSNRD